MTELATMKTNGWHQRPSVTDVIFAKADGPFQPAPVTVNGHAAYTGTGIRIVVDNSPQSSDVLNNAGQVVNSLHNPSQGFLVVSLAQGPDGQFRISDITSVNPPGGISAFES
jgi:hypothetical protein